ncbi:MAG TPA: metallophosphoesterase [Methanomassiliicoccales archaeon]|jgi:UDP-2,3-diacylglucosamine pyrophosphatase LpxH
MVVSDVHLGSDKCDKTAFNGFLNSLGEDNDLTDLVLLGDIVDMWRRDASGVFLENMDTVRIIKDLGNRINVHWVAGNHDYHLLKLKNRAPHYNYPFEFHETLELTDGPHTYRFMHGYEFEYGDEIRFIKPILEMLCHVMSDAEGVPEDEMWVSITKIMADIHYSAFSHLLEGKDLTVNRRSLHDTPAERLKDKLEKLEARSFDEIRGKAGTVLVFGHTHHPFINIGESLVNAGSWVRDAEPHNTFVVLEEGKPRLFVFGGREITERIEIV